MAAPTIGQLVFVTRPQGLDHGFDPALVLANIGSGSYPPAGTYYAVTALAFSPTGGGGLVPQTVTVNLYPDRATADTYRSAQGAAVWAASVV
jgi:hypothetical protein